MCSRSCRYFNPQVPCGTRHELGSWLDNLTANGHLYGARCELKKEENSLDALAKGIIKIHIYLAVPRLASEVDFVIEYDSSYIESALSEILA